jgi:hypothetical protein
LGHPIYISDGQLKPDRFRFEPEFRRMGVGVSAIFHSNQFYHGSDFCSTQPVLDSLSSLEPIEATKTENLVQSSNPDRINRNGPLTMF